MCHVNKKSMNLVLFSDCFVSRSAQHLCPCMFLQCVFIIIIIFIIANFVLLLFGYCSHCIFVAHNTHNDFWHNENQTPFKIPFK